MSSSSLGGKTGRFWRGTRAAAGATVLALTLLSTSACGPDNSSADAAATASAPGLGLPANLDDLKKWKFEDWEKWAKDYALPATAKGVWTLEKLLEAKPDEPIAPPGPAPQAPASQPGQPPAQSAQPSQAPAPATSTPKSPAGQPAQPGHPTTPVTPPAAPKPSNTQQPASQAPAQPAPPAAASQAPASQPGQPPAQSAQPSQAPQQSQPPAANGSDPAPQTVNAQPVPHPYTNYGVHGKLFYDLPGTAANAAGGLNHGQCSATVVADPAHPGKSNLVWTAGHCVHQGNGGQFYSNLTFIPAFNSSGALSGGKQADEKHYAPFGVWPATQAVTSPQWKAEGGKSGSAATHYDFGILRVQPPEGAKSLEETVGGALPVWFNAPRDQLSINEFGYPALEPYDGRELNHCESGKPSRLSYDPSRPPMLAIGCNMTAGSSGGGWLALRDGKPVLVSDISVGKHDGEPKFQAGPYLDDVAAGAYNFLSKKG